MYQLHVMDLVNFFHDSGGFVLERGEISISRLGFLNFFGIIIDGETELDELVDTASEDVGRSKGKARS
jgi:hypothetical protein